MGAAPSDDDFQRYLQSCEALMVADHRYSIVLVAMPQSPMPKARHARAQATWMKLHDAAISRHVASMAFVLIAAAFFGYRKLTEESPAPAPGVVDTPPPRPSTRAPALPSLPW